MAIALFVNRVPGKSGILSPHQPIKEIIMSKLLTVRQVLNRIEKIGLQDKSKVLTCGATHIAQDADGEYYAYKGEPKALSSNEWGSAYGKDNRCMLYCGQGDKPKDHTSFVLELP